MRIGRNGSRVSRAIGKWVAGGLALLLIGTTMATTGALPAQAAEGASLLVVKTVDGQAAERDLRPGDSVTYRVEFRVNDEDADAPVAVVDALPAEFAGWQISNLSAVVGGSTSGVTLDLPGVTAGASPSAPVSGTIGSSATERTITVGVEQTVQAGAGNTSGMGMSTRDTGVLEYIITIPDDLSPTDPILRHDLVNTATFTAKSGVVDLSASDDAIISVDNPITADVEPSKSWAPSSQSYQPNQSSTITIGARQASNVNASSISLQDPSDAALAPDGATALPAGNPFNYVDFAGFTSPSDPTSTLPTWATSATVEVYRLLGGSWSWATWNSSIPSNTIAGVRTSYTGDIPPDSTVSQGFNVEQRSTHRATGARISTGYDIENEVLATVEVPGEDPVSKSADASFEVTPERIDVSAEKSFYTLPGGPEMENLGGVTAGDSVGVVLRAINGAIPQSTTLDSLTITEPGAGSNAAFFGDDLIFGGFDNSDTTAIWPNGATAATLTWQHAGGPTVVSLNTGDPLPAAPSGVTVAGFELEFTGAIAPNAASVIRYTLDTNEDEGFIAPGDSAQSFRNTIDITGAKSDLPDDTANAGATVSLVAPRIDVTIDKRVGPGFVLPGQDVIVQLDTSAETSGGRTKPTTIVVEDVFGGAETFWDAFDAAEILPPISRPTNSGTPASQANLTIEWLGADGVTWTTLVTNPDEYPTTPLTVPASATGLRFVYENTDGLSQTTYVKPNIRFTARDTLRSDGSEPTGSTFNDPIEYENVATAQATGTLDSRTVTGDDTDAVDVTIRGDENGTGPGPDGIWVDKDWAHSNLTSQSGTSTWTTQSWVVAGSGYETVQLQDPAITTASGAGTVFEAFDLTRIRPIRYTTTAPNSTFDPLMRWEVVSDVQLFDGSSWHSVTPTSGNWMDADGFTGYELTTAERASTIGVRLVLVENGTAREDAADTGDLTAPAKGSGVTASAQTRQFQLDWQLRNVARPDSATPKWVKEDLTTFNCVGGATGCIDNEFELTATPDSGPNATTRANDTIQLVDSTTNVDLTKRVRPLPVDSETPPAGSIDLVVPNPGELAQSDYPRARFTLTAQNSSTTPTGSRGAMKLGKIRVNDTSTSKGTSLPGYDIGTSPFAGRDYAMEVASAEGNHFDVFNLTGVSFGTLPEYIDTDDSTVELWLFDETDGTESIQSFTLQQALDGGAAFTDALPEAIGISVTYSGTNPEQNGNRILVGDDLVMHLDVQLRATERLSEDDVTGGTLGSLLSVPNEAIARGWDAVVAPSNQPTNIDDANVNLAEARVNVGLDKSVSVDHSATGGPNDQTIIETDPDSPVSVLLTANANGSTAPLNTLRIEDKTTSFWERFEFVSFDSPNHPDDADHAEWSVLVGGAWVAFSSYTGDLTDIVGVAIDFDRNDDQLFPLGATSWNASWGTATLPFTVKLRGGVTVDWSGDEEENTATVLANNIQYGQADESADAELDFSPGVHRIEVVKRAPNDTSTHQVEALAGQQWRLVFTNTGTSYLPIESVTDALPSTLSWDGEQPTFASAGGSGLSIDPSDITVTPAADGSSLSFEWPSGSRMEPGESMTIQLGLILQPLPTGQIATNEVVVDTGVTLATCTQPTNFGQDPQTPVSATECSNTNFVQARAGTVIGARKTVNGEHVDTLGENLVGGALDVRTGDECAPGNYLPIGSDFTRNPCASYTAVGATDTWKLEQINSGTNPLSRMTIVDMMPHPGDQMLAGGAPRNSTFRPVFVGATATDIFDISGLPAGATYDVDVTTEPTACIGPNPGSSLWVADPECSDTATNPANIWTSIGSYSGEIEEIAGFRITIDMTVSPLQPSGNVTVEFETVNRVVDTAADGLTATLAQYETPQFAWNQNGVIAWDTSNNRVNLPAAPQRAGVTVMTGELVISKEILGEGAVNAPDEFTVELACTVPSGLADPARVPLDLGVRATLTVPRDGSVTVPGMPIGADCVATETGVVGEFGESGRSIEVTPGVSPATDGLSADIQIRDRGGDDTLLTLRNTYTLGELVFEKAVLSSNEYEPRAEQRDARYDFELVCTANGLSDDVRRSFSLSAGEQHSEPGLPDGADCSLTEIDTHGAESTVITIAGVETNGPSRDGIVVAAEGAHVLVSNVFEGISPDDLEKTGSGSFPIWVLAGGIAMLLIGAAGAFIAARRQAMAMRRE